MIAIFFLAMLIFGIFVSWRSTRKSVQTSKSMMIGNNDIGVVVGTLTLSGSSGLEFQVSAVAQCEGGDTRFTNSKGGRYLLRGN